MSAPRGSVTQAEYELLADLRYSLREFTAFSEKAAQDTGLTPAQHQALLAIKGFVPTGTISVGDLARRLLVRHHSAVGLVDRLTAQGWLRRVPDPKDRRRVGLVLSARGEAVLARLSAVHRDELRRIGPQIEALLVQIRVRGFKPATERAARVIPRPARRS